MHFAGILPIFYTGKDVVFRKMNGNDSIVKRPRARFHRGITSAAISFVFVLLLIGFSFASSLRPDESRITTVAKIIDYVYADSFETAYSMVEAVNDTLPEKPLYNLITASILHAEMTDLEDYSEKDEFFSRLDTSKKFFQEWIKDNPEDPWGYYFMGTVHAYKSMWHGQHRSWLKTLIEGLKARGKYMRALEIDPELYDAYAGLGNFHFWASVKLEKYLPFLKDNRETGLEELRLAIDSSHFSSKPAATGLAWALIDQRRFREASRIGMELYNDSSGGRVSLWILGGVYWRWGRLKKAEFYYGELIESLKSLEKQNYYNLVICRYRKGVCLYLMRKYEDAREEFDILLSYDAPKKTRDRHKKVYEKTEEYLEKIYNRLNKEK
jgi:tetratricopeptide (TPR) repeat protein